MSDLSAITGPISSLQNDLREALKAHNYFADIPVLTEKQKDIEYEIEKSLSALAGEGGGRGICCIVLTPKMTVEHPDIPGPYFGNVSIVVRVMENVLVNQGDDGTKKQAGDVALMASALLHHFRKRDFYEAVNCKEVGIVPDPDYLAYDATFTTQFGLPQIR